MTENILIGVGSTYALWLFYLACMNLIRAHEAGTMSRVAYVLGVPILVVGIALDVFVNLFVFTVLFIEPPREWTVTARLQRHAGRDNWRGRFARFFAFHVLDVFDPSGRHI